MKPPLLLRDLDLGREFTPLAFPITDALVDAFCEATGETNPLFVDADAARAGGFVGRVAPPGLAGIFGRQAYLRDYVMPPGGVLAGQSIDFHGPAFVGDTLDENNETIILALSNPSAGLALGSPSTLTITIEDDDEGGVVQFQTPVRVFGE